MCVTPFPAEINHTRVCVYDAGNGRHNIYYHNQTSNRSAGPNCMFINLAGHNLATVDGPQHTTRFMRDLTDNVDMVDELEGPTRGYSGRSAKAVVEEYGDDYTLVYSEGAGDILGALDRVRSDHRPNLQSDQVAGQLDRFVRLYMERTPNDSFLLVCFSGNVEQNYPIVLSYEPIDPGVLTAPGLDGHDGELPEIGGYSKRDFRVTFGVAGVNLPIQPNYRDEGVAGQPWAPKSVCGFWDYTRRGPNRDYRLSLKALHALSAMEGEGYDSRAYDPEVVYGLLG